MNLKRLFKELYFDRFASESTSNPEIINVDWENIIFYTEQPKLNTINMVVYFKHVNRPTWNRANIVINTNKFRIEEMEFFPGDVSSLITSAPAV